MGKAYVVMGAQLECSEGLAPSSLVVLPQHMVQVGGKILANIGDCKPMVNVLPFGMCNSKTNPAVIAATAAAMGVHTPMPCTPACSVWMGGQADVLLDGMFPLMEGDTTICPLGLGTIEVKDSGQ